jgi:toxin YoeB
MNYQVKYDPQADIDIAYLKKTDIRSFTKLVKLIKELYEHPRSGTGKPEQLKHNLQGLWSRRISGKHRLVYSINDNEVKVLVISAKGHYEDK